MPVKPVIKAATIQNLRCGDFSIC